MSLPRLILVLLTLPTLMLASSIRKSDKALSFTALLTVMPQCGQSCFTRLLGPFAALFGSSLCDSLTSDLVLINSCVAKTCTSAIDYDRMQVAIQLIPTFCDSLTGGNSGTSKEASHDGETLVENANTVPFVPPAKKDYTYTEDIGKRRDGTAISTNTKLLLASGSMGLAATGVFALATLVSILAGTL
ncbi:hypothetical protein BDR26DRAFT_1006268 [Obelidium mucronatum]|nr:hypothetical protein BDR26DRAFT_1006268 [Obelidium mucronatum]